jgi:hypothetical protein
LVKTIDPAEERQVSRKYLLGSLTEFDHLSVPIWSEVDNVKMRTSKNKCEDHKK